MKQYRHIVVAIALNEASDRPIIEKALAMAKEYQATITLVHAIESVSNFGAAYGVNASINVDDVLYDQEKALFEAVADELGVTAERQVLLSGTPKHVILEHAKEARADLIILGSHGRHGARLLLGSTANAILHGATCDVLAVRLPS